MFSIRLPHISKLSRRILVAALLFFCALVISYNLVSWRSASGIYTSVDTTPKNPVGLLLGTTSTVGGQENLYFRYRINAVRDLYLSGRIDCVLVSWDNSTEFYNEAKDMQSALMGQWIPPERIFLDYAGFRTLDSIVRAKEVFGQKRFTIISQKFHLERALWIAKHFTIDAVGYTARDVPWSLGLKTMIREIGSRLALYYDLYIADTAPKFLGEPVQIPMDASERPVPEKICTPR